MCIEKHWYTQIAELWTWEFTGSPIISWVKYDNLTSTPRLKWWSARVYNYAKTVKVFRLFSFGPRLLMYLILGSLGGLDGYTMVHIHVPRTRLNFQQAIQKSRFYKYNIYIYTLWLFNIVMENGPFIDGFTYLYINKLRWYPQQPQRFNFTNLSEACCEAKRWKHLSWVSVN